MMAKQDNSEFDGWDPLTEHYNDPDRNTYDTGAGAKLPPDLQPANRRGKDSDVTLFVRPMSSRYTEDSLKNMFSNYGVVTDVRIVYPRHSDENKSAYGFVTYKSQASANEAIRVFNDSSKFEFKVSFSKGPQRNNDQQDNSKRFNDSDRPRKDRFNDSDRPRKDRFNDFDRPRKDRINDSVRSQRDQTTFETTTKEPDFSFTPKSARPNDFNNENDRLQKHQNSQSNFRDSTEASSASNADENHRSYRNHSRVPSETSSESVTAANENHRPYKNQNIQSHSRAPHAASLESSPAANHRNIKEDKVKPVVVKKDSEETPAMAVRINPLLCSFCQKLTFEVCSICFKGFCNLECTSNGWKLHASPDCIQVAALIPLTKANAAKNEPLSNNRNVNDTKSLNDVGASNDNSITFSNDLKTVYASDASSPNTEYREFANLAEDYCINVGKNTESQFSPVCDNNYDENPPNDTFSPPSSFQQQQNTSRPFKQHNGEVGGRSFKARSDDDRNGPNDQERCTGRRFRNRDDKDGVSDSDGSFRGCNSIRGVSSGLDNKRNFNDKPNHQRDECDDTETESKPSRGGYKNDDKDFKGPSKPRNGHRNRGNIGGRGDGEANTSTEFTPQAHSSYTENNTRSPSSVQGEQKIFELNKTYKVTVTYVEKDSTHYVRLAENEGVFQNIIKALKDTKPIPLDVIKVGSKCVARYNHGWYRGTIRSENPLSVFLVDVGTVLNERDERDVGSVPDVAGLSSYRPFAIRVKMPNVSREALWKWYTENTVITIRPTSLEDKTYIAEFLPLEQQIATSREGNEHISQQSSAPAPVSTPTPSSSVALKSKNVFNGCPTLESGKLTKVLVTFISNDIEFFVVFQDLYFQLNEIISKVDVNTLSPLLEIRQGVLAYAPYSGEYCRVEIVSVDPLKINFIDFGNVEKGDVSTLKVLPSACSSLPPLAIKIKLYDGTVTSNNVIEYQQIAIIPLKMENSTTWLALHGDKSDEYDSIMRTIEAPSKPSSSVPKISVDLSITYAVSKSEVYGVLKSDLAQLTKLSATLNDSAAQLGPVRVPELNKIYLSIFEDTWCRGRLVSLSPLKINYFDYGNTELCKAEELFEFPVELQNQPPPLARKMKLLKESKGVLEFGHAVTALMDVENDTYLLTHDPTDPQSSANQASCSRVNVVSALGDSNYAVILEENREMYKYINQQIRANFDELSKPKKIAINELCLAFYEDDNWHRAKIVNLSPLTVRFLDFYDEMRCDFRRLKTMPSNLTKIPPLAFKIKTEEYIQLEEASEVKIAKIEEIEYDYWKVGTIKEGGCEDAGPSRIQIISDPKHIAEFQRKKKAKSVSNTIKASLSKGTSVPEECVRFTARTKRDDETVIKIDLTAESAEDIPRRVENDSRKPSEKEPPQDQSLVQPRDENCLLYMVLSNKPTNYPTKVNTLTNGVRHLALSDPIRNSTFDDIHIPISDHLLDALRPDDNCVLIVYDTFSDDEYTGMLLCKRLQRMIDILDVMEKNLEAYAAKRGDCVVTYVEGINIWQRAYVVSEPSNVDPFYHVILFDVGKMHKTDEVYRLNDEFRRVPVLSVKINVTRFQPLPEDIARLEDVSMNFSLFEGATYQPDKSTYNLKLTQKTEEGFVAELRSQFYCENASHTVQLMKWHPSREELGVKHVPVMEGDVVKIGYICQTNQCYVIPIDDFINEQRNDFLSKVALHCRKAKSIEGELKLKQIVGVPYMKSYFRGQVVEKRMNCYLFHILDLGAEVKVPKDQIKELPDNLKFADCYAVCVQLNNVPCTDFSQMAENFLKHVITYENEFILHINKSTRLIELKFKEEVECLVMASGSNFNERLSQLLMPIWKIEALDFGARYFLLQMKFEEWPIGIELSLVFVESLDEKSGFMINRYGETYAKLMRVNLDERLKEYAEECKESYLPVKDELCIAKFENQWFRAVCDHTEPGKPLSLQFVDIGYRRIVEHTDIRRMHSDFLKHPAAALLCDIKNYMDCKSLPELQGKVLKRCKVLQKLEEGAYAIHVANLNAYV